MQIFRLCLIAALFISLNFYLFYLSRRLKCMFENKTKIINKYSPFETRVYTVAFENVDVNYNYIFIIKDAKFADCFKLKKDVLNRTINMIILDNHVYNIEYHDDDNIDNNHLKFKIISECSSFYLSGCSRQRKISNMKRNINHVLGFFIQ